MGIDVLTAGSPSSKYIPTNSDIQTFQLVQECHSVPKLAVRLYEESTTGKLDMRAHFLLLFKTESVQLM